MPTDTPSPSGEDRLEEACRKFVCVAAVAGAVMCAMPVPRTKKAMALEPHDATVVAFEEPIGPSAPIAGPAPFVGPMKADDGGDEPESEARTSPEPDENESPRHRLIVADPEWEDEEPEDEPEAEEPEDEAGEWWLSTGASGCDQGLIDAGYLVEWDYHLWAAHWYTDYGRIIQAMQPGDLVHIDGTTVRIAGSFDVPYDGGSVEDVRASWPTEYLFQTCYGSGYSSMMMKYGYPV